MSDWPGWAGLFKAAFPNSREGAAKLAHVPDKVMRVYLALARFANENGDAWPSTTTLAKVCGKSRWRILDALAEGEGLGLWTIQKSDGKGNHYCLTWPIPTCDEIVTCAENSTCDESSTGPVTILAPEPVTKLSQRSRPRKKAKKKVTGIDPWQAAKAHMTTDALDTPQMENVWREWAEHRRQIKKRLTPATIKKQIAKLERIGHDRAVAAIEHSIEQGWTGIYEPKAQAAGQNGHSVGSQWTPSRLFRAIQAGEIREAITRGNAIDLTSATAYGEAGIKSNGDVLLATRDIHRSIFR